MARILNPHGPTLNALYFVHFYFVLITFLLINMFLKVRSKNKEKIQDEEIIALEKDHDRAMEILDLDNRLFIIYEKKARDEDELEQFFIDPFSVNYISKEFRRKLLFEDDIFSVLNKSET